MPNSIRSEFYFPSLKFQNVKSVDVTTEFDARKMSYYWLKNMANGVQAEYRVGYKIVSYCNFQFLDFPFELLECNVTFQMSASADYRATLEMPIVYFSYKNKDISSKPIASNLPFEILIEPIAPWRIFELEFGFTATGITLTLRRNNLGLLISHFFGPMFIFSLLSMLSYNIPTEMVILQHSFGKIFKL